MRPDSLFLELVFQIQVLLLVICVVFGRFLDIIIKRILQTFVGLLLVFQDLVDLCSRQIFDVGAEFDLHLLKHG